MKEIVINEYRLKRTLIDNSLYKYKKNNLKIYL